MCVWQKNKNLCNWQWSGVGLTAPVAYTYKQHTITLAQGANWNRGCLCEPKHLRPLNEIINHIYSFPSIVCKTRCEYIMRHMCHKWCFCLLYKVCCGVCERLFASADAISQLQARNEFYIALFAISCGVCFFTFWFVSSVSRDACKSNNTRCNTRREHPTAVS